MILAVSFLAMENALPAAHKKGTEDKNPVPLINPISYEKPMR